VLPVFDDLLPFDGALVIRQDVLASHADLEALAKTTALAEATV